VLSRGDLIGYVGNTGNASGGASHLHFEIRADRSPTDPYPRLTQEFSLAEKIASTGKILTVASNSSALAGTLLSNFRSTFAAAQAQGVPLPPALQSALVIANQPHVPATGIPSLDLSLGDSGTGVVQLQQFLITNSKGVAGAKLSSAGATGYFGSITIAALAEYQSAVGIKPADGSYNISTRVFIGITTPVSTPVTPPNSTDTARTSLLIAQVQALQEQLARIGANTTNAFARNLSIGSTGSDVQALQTYLNTHGFLISSVGAGSSGNETEYFGPATERALIQFQIAHNIVPAVGYFGQLTRAALS